VQADAILPKADPALADKKLGAAVLKEMRDLQFAGQLDAKGRYEGMLKFITDRGNVSWANIEKYLAGGIAAAVEHQFNRIGFVLDKDDTVTYTCSLVRDPVGGQYTLHYDRPLLKNYEKEITATSLNALLAALKKNTADFNQSCIDQVSAWAAVIPAVKLGKEPLGLITDILASFYKNPTPVGYDMVVAVHKLYWDTGISSSGNTRALISNIGTSYYNTIAELNKELADQSYVDALDASKGNRATALSSNQQKQLLTLR
jgi:hypothetical protein